MRRKREGKMERERKIIIKVKKRRKKEGKRCKEREMERGSKRKRTRKEIKV